MSDFISTEVLDAKSDDQIVTVNIQEDLNQPIIVYLGSELLSNIQNILDSKYQLIDGQNIEKFISLLKDWSRHFHTLPEVILIHDSLLADLSKIKFDEVKKKSGFKTVPVIVFSNQLNKKVKQQAWSIGADEYFHEPIKFKSLIPRIKFYKRLKAAGFSRQDAILKKDKVYKMYFLKRSFDIAVAGTALLLFSPILILVAIAIKLESKGPIFYVSRRAGTNYKVFNFYKFRSMQVDADTQLEKLKETSNQYQDGNQFVKIKNDPRVTRIGDFLRNSSLDEIPQLFNVLKGDMSIVGNRPLPLYEAKLLTTDNHAERFLGPAGITGLWQTMKRGKAEMSAEERIMLDRIYVRKNSLLFDFKLMLMTIPALIQSEKV
ncbi:sugar transferase [Reichenbachiella agarivorans]|uniref:Sugar transferase n=1 Tax=Reichenbachiella agarivorans TaxID=2979464 RepID=A0ABY6CPI0_9BACT|nr:sugar transferase [Reichenbachiella agarivorans]UXP32421.1 sugar transferase [Reichenbachiella agarivorans]